MLYRAREREIEHTLVGKRAVVVISLPEAALGRVSTYAIFQSQTKAEQIPRSILEIAFNQLVLTFYIPFG
jgi:hypothetical protein